MLIVSVDTSCDLVMNNFQRFQVWTMSSIYRLHFCIVFFFLKYAHDDCAGFKVFGSWLHLKSRPLMKLEKSCSVVPNPVVETARFSLCFFE